jgi:hypothetical protein
MVNGTKNRQAFIPGLILLAIILSNFQSMAQQDDLADRLFEAHPKYKETALTQRRFKQKDIMPLIAKREGNKTFEIQTVGSSFEGRPIQMIRIGNGPRKVLLWTQMHGDEPTATMASFDILNFFEAKNDGFDDLRKSILSNTTLYFIPMLNPDGAERYQRRNAQEIDINRDALALQAPESRILKTLQQTLLPEFGFNLHDKNPRYSVGKTPKLATISFLATAYNEEKSVNEVREKSMKLISVMNRAMQKYIPEQVGRWNDDFEPRAFGDNIQKWGTTLILIESGGFAGDPEKQYIRKLNFVALLTGLHAIADNSFANETSADYNKLKENSRYIYDLLIKNATVKMKGQEFRTDLGIDRQEVNQKQATAFYYKSTIEEYGDLSIFSGTEQLDAEGYVIEHGKLFPTAFKTLSAISEAEAWSMLKQGFTYVKITSGMSGKKSVRLPLTVVKSGKAFTNTPALDDPATFVLKKNGVIKYAVVNGFVYDVTKGYQLLGNGIVE